VRDNPYVTGEFLWVGIDYLGEAIKWPRKGWEWGLIDLAGFEKTIYYIRQSYWSETPMVHIAVNLKKKNNFQWNCYDVASHWNFKKGETDSVFVYSNCEEVELFINNKSLGKKKVDKNTYYALYHVDYKPGTLKAVAMNQSKKVARHVLQTADEPSRLQLFPDKGTAELAKDELLYIPIEITDKNGVRCPLSTLNIRVEVEGSGELIGIDSGNQSSHEVYKTDHRNAFEGRILATVRPTKSGVIRVKAYADNLVAGQKEITVK
jgi:beta-galactosidase